MKATSAILLAVSCWAATAAEAAAPRVYTYDPPSADSRPAPRSTTLYAVPARLVLAQRAGVEDFHSADLDREDVVQAINDFGVRTPMFAKPSAPAKKAVFLTQNIEPEDIEELLRPYFTFQLDGQAPADAAEELYLDFITQDAPNPSGTRFEQLHHKDDVARLFHESKQAGLSITIITSRESTHEPSRPYRWGTYAMPNAQSQLKRRSEREQPLHSTDAVRPLASSALPLASSSPLPGILPACFTSLAACQRTTRNCTGHGECLQKFHDKDAASGSGNCFACACRATTSHDGQVTTQWGGPACQKKDISVQFWLITLFTVGLIFLVGFAIGQIWEMGNEELPSVIGAGVSGPSARK